MCWTAVATGLGILTSAKSLTSSTSAPSTTTISPTPTAVDTTSGADAIDSQKEARRKAALAAGYSSTIKTGSTGDMSTATTGKKSLLGG
jgi:hypothetical protein